MPDESVEMEGQEGSEGTPGSLAEALAYHRERLLPFARHAADVLAVALESVTAQSGQVEEAAVAAAEARAVASEFGTLDHLAFELRIAFGDAAPVSAAALLPLEDAGTLFVTDTSAAEMADESFALAQLESISGSMRELLDMVSLSLFSGLDAAEVSLVAARRGEVEQTLAAFGGPELLRMDLRIAGVEGSRAAVTLIFAASLLDGLAELLGEDATADGGLGREPASGIFDHDEQSLFDAFAAGEGRGFGLSDEALNVTPMARRQAAEHAPATGRAATAVSDVPVHPVHFPQLGEGATEAASRSLDLIMDVSMRLTVELGRTSKTIEEILALGPGSVVELNKLAGEPVDVLVNDRLIARGEVVVVDENFGVRVTEIVSPRTRAHAMSR